MTRHAHAPGRWSRHVCRVCHRSSDNPIHWTRREAALHWLGRVAVSSLCLALMGWLWWCASGAVR